MNTIHNLKLFAIDMADQLQRELQLSSDGQKQMRDAFALLREALENAERVTMSVIEERMRSLSEMIGTGKPTPETVDGTVDAPKALSRSKPKAEEAGD